MNNPLNHIKKEAQHIRLSEQEKAYMRAHIFERVGASRRAQEAMRRGRSSRWFVFSARYSMALASVFLMLVGGTTTYAAQGSLPGGMLYPVKIYVNETIKEKLAVSNEAKMSYHTAIAQERLKEAETLASEGRLDARATIAIEENFNDHVAKAEQIAVDLEESDPAAGVEVQVTLDSSIEAHSSVLSRIGGSSSDEKTKEHSNSIAERIRSRLPARAGGHGVVATARMVDVQEASQTQATSLSMKAELAPGRSLSKKSGEMSSSQKKVAQQLQKRAEEQLQNARSIFDDAKYSLDASTTAKVETRLQTLQEQFDAGSAQVESGEYVAARAAFAEVLRGSVELGTLIKASQKYKRDLVRSDKEREDERKGGEVAGASIEKEDQDKNED